MARPPPLNHSRLVVIYLRGTDAERLAQRARATAWAQASRLDVAAVHEDPAGPAELARRPGLLAALETLDRVRARLLLVTHPTVLCERTGTLTAQIYGWVRATGAKVRTSAAIPVAPPPPPRPAFGQRLERGRLVDDAYELAVIARARELFAEGMLPAHVTAALAELGYTSRTGRRIGQDVVTSILQRAGDLP